VVSGVYREAFAKRGIALKQRIAQPLSALIESGDISSEHLRNAAKQVIGPLRNCSHILLACTHYPAITPVLRELVSSKTEFIDPAAELVRRLEKLKISGTAEDVFLTTGDAGAMKKAAFNAFGVAIPHIERVTI
jgi:glutamate racemase